MVKYLPGFAGAIIAFIALQFLGWLELSLRGLAFLVIYLIVTISVNQALTRYYGRPDQ